MQISQASLYKSFNNKSDLIYLIREQAKIKQKNMDNYTVKKLKEFQKLQLYRIFAVIENNK